MPVWLSRALEQNTTTLSSSHWSQNCRSNTQHGSTREGAAHEMLVAVSPQSHLGCIADLPHFLKQRQLVLALDAQSRVIGHARRELNDLVAELLVINAALAVAASARVAAAHSGQASHRVTRHGNDAIETSTRQGLTSGETGSNACCVRRRGSLTARQR